LGKERLVITELHANNGKSFCPLLDSSTSSLQVGGDKGEGDHPASGGIFTLSLILPHQGGGNYGGLDDGF
jgi:hypothetical protein